MRAPEELTVEFRRQGLKVTPQRQLLFRLLHGNTQHPTAEALFAAASAQMPGISLRTVYQTLNDLADMGELRPLSLGGATRFDPNLAAHHHALCDRCGSLRDVYVDALDGVHVIGLDGFTPSGASIVFSGLCAACSTSPDEHASNHISTPTPKEQQP